jgi:FAD/FMN-containing dehydrogenase
MTAVSWGRYPHAPARREIAWGDRFQPLPPNEGSILAYGAGRSYGDVALNGGQTLLLARGLDRFMQFDPATGVLRAEAGVMLSEVLELAVPQGWFPAVTPGTQFVTLGGAVANDVHGKNHHRAGAFGNWVRRLELLRSDGSRRECAPGDADGLFEATVGGLGLTGLITWVELQLLRIPGPCLQVEQRRFAALDAYWELDATLGQRHAYSVAWLDCQRGGRGIYSAGDFVAAPGPRDRRRGAGPRVPFVAPVSLVNPWTAKAFSTAYYAKPLPATGIVHYQPFFYPLDGVQHWNRVYGPRGFVQYQCVLPPPTMAQALRELLAAIQGSGQASPLAVLKTFGDTPSRGMLSFARPGATLAVDFPLRDGTLPLLQRLDAIVRGAGGALYPAKDARMTPEMFESSYPRAHAFAAFQDPAFSSSFWRRVSRP